MLKDSASFRDPSGYVFEHQDCIYRNISKNYIQHFEFLTHSGLAEKLFGDELLVRHEIVNLPGVPIADKDFLIKPERLPVITYPYEWGFSQLKDAALLTLKILQLSLEHGMILKDASAFNVQFKGFKPIFIDTLSFEKYEDGQPWSAYNQFCEHFLGPLCLSSYVGVEFQSLLKFGVNGVPLKMASKILPWYTWFNPSTLFHIHLHSKTVDFYSAKSKTSLSGQRKISKKNLFAMIEHVKSFIDNLRLNKSDKTQWENYNEQTHYSETSRKSKAAIINEFVNKIDPLTIWDVGANDGFFSRSIASPNRQVLSLDADFLAIEKNFLTAKELKNDNVYSLLMDITNPSTDIGWANQERKRLALRAKPDLVMALALIHHMVITHNIPFIEIAKYFSSLSDWLIIEYVPMGDLKIELLPETAGKKMYNRANFTSAFLSVFQMIEERKIDDSERTLLLLRKL